MPSDTDIHYMKSALSLAQRGIGRTEENPSVGCIVVKDGIIVARARTADGGRPHAEKRALEQAGAQAEGATLYVTLEPCSHHGQTPPCVEAIIKAGITRVFIGTNDVDPRTEGQSVELLRQAGIEVVQGILEEECRAVHAGFIKRITENRPFVTLKTACTLDGKTATSSGESKWITAKLARRHAHLVRSRHDAILIGIGTALADNPMLTTRLEGVKHTLARIVLDRHLRLSPDSRLAQSAKDYPLWVFYEEKSDNHDGLKQAGAVLHQADCTDLSSVLKILADQGINRLLVEGGAEIHASFLRAKLCDELLIYRAPTLLGAEGKSVVGALRIDALAQRRDYSRKSSISLGADILEIYEKK